MANANNSSNNNAKIMLSTVDNPYDPFSSFDEWYAFDMSKGYNTLGYLARVTVLSDELTEAQRDDEIDFAISQAARLNITGNYIKVKEGAFIRRSVHSKP
jgi:hypothetical protein